MDDDVPKWDGLLLGIFAVMVSVPLWMLMLGARWEAYVKVNFPEPRGEGIWAYDPFGFGIISLSCGVLLLYGLCLICTYAHTPQDQGRW